MAERRYVSYKVFSDHPKHKHASVDVFIPEGTDPLVAGFNQSHDLRSVPATFTKGKASFQTRFSFRRNR